MACVLLGVLSGLVAVILAFALEAGPAIAAMSYVAGGGAATLSVALARRKSLVGAQGRSCTRAE
ncbi:MAG: hypothetical protein CML43_17005 [Rhodobacteraceae bacterium]|nr:hypothetical protein [Paracoccaceae bacterium]